MDLSEKLGKWYPISLIILFGTVAASLLSAADLYSRVSLYFSDKNILTVTARVCTTAEYNCDVENRNLAELLNKNIGSSIDFNLTYYLTTNGEYYIKCSEEISIFDVGMQPNEDGIFALPQNHSDCDSLNFLRIAPEELALIETNMGDATFLIKGKHIIGLGHLGGITMYNLIKEN